MFRKGFLLIWLVVASLTVTTTVHAQEFPGMVTLECSGAVHTENSEKSSPGDTDPGVMHHHGCHSASHFLPGDHAVSSLLALPTDDYPTSRFAGHRVRHAGPDLRPPIV